ncbi:hypothetical protein [Ilumatobacter sp.]|uniref:hypothetical protein n=1 Tax=Ilumatobacter sp. TaxID=1967498 RepID=UPI003AFA00BA
MPGDETQRPAADVPPAGPPAPFLPASVPAAPQPMSRFPDDEVAGDDPWAAETPETPETQEQMSGERLATRNVPPPPQRIVPASPPVGQPALDLPEVEPMGQATTALLLGRSLFAVAALLIGLAARRSTGVGGEERASAFWSVVGSAGVLTFVGIVGLAFWSVTVAGNARRLRTRTASAWAMGWSWMIPVGWVAVSSLTYLRIEVDAEIDPLPVVAGLGWMIAVTIPYGRLQGVCRGLSRRPPIVWVSAYPIDVIAFGLIWWRLTSWPSPVGPEADHVRLTANIAFGASAALAVNVLVYVWLAGRTSSGVYERLGRLEALQRPDAGTEPEWFRTGLAARQALAPPVVTRPLIPTRRLGAFVAALHVLWGGAVVLFGILMATLAFDYSGKAVFDGDELVVEDADADLIVAIATAVGALFAAAIVVHGIWAALMAYNARRITVHSPNPGTFVLAFAPAPLLLIAGLVVGGRGGYALVAVGLTVGFVAVILVNQMLLALSGRMGRQLHGFSRWTVCLVLTYAAGFFINLMFSQSTSQLGVYATLSLVQGVLISLGGFIGYSAMDDLGDELRSHRQVHRVAG